MTMQDNLRKYTKKILAAALCAQSYNPLKNYFIPLGIAVALPIPLALVLFHSTHQVVDSAAPSGTLSSLLAMQPEYWLQLIPPLLSGWLFGIIGTLYQEKSRKVLEKVEILNRKAILDPLTGISNRRYFLENFSEELARNRRKRTPLSLVFIDLDHFKSINDRFGHQVGAEILSVAAEHLVQNCRPYDNLARWEGEEFIILLPDTDEKKALGFAERIRNSFLEGLNTSIPLRVTTSIGVAQYSPGDSVEQLVEKADKALYHAKAVGRNTAIAWSSLQINVESEDSRTTVA
ncbi:GGDEF domain-containing protein [Desulfosediminicola ganghwensis]|uniref:GGDEF domain-containing protein n=1 Tax=Desulfosediminicola ganghwensis TaxID=2569540 RepID=UPI0010AC7049|nr:GGDEF domain-containing protein [Desulfosediminicola ganghwensis]